MLNHIPLHADRSGFLDAEDFGAFMRKGAPEEGPTWQERRQAAQDAKGAAARAEMDRRVGRDLNTKFKDVTPASDEEVTELSQQVHSIAGGG